MNAEASEKDTDYDVLVIGSGFGGSVTALRLAEKGYRVGVLEAGRRFDDADFAKTSWDVRRFLWAPKLGAYGIQRIHLLRDCVILAGAGVGGALSTTPTPSTSRDQHSSAIRSGRTSQTGKTS